MTVVTDTDTLTGVVAHDTTRDPFPVSGWDAVVWASGNATQAAHVLPAGVRDAA